MSGFFIAFEGADGCGKSTQMRFFADFLEELGVSAVRTREPGGCTIAEKIRDIVLDKENTQMTAVTEAMLYAAARAQHVRQVIKPAIDSGKIVLCDRFLYSSLAYQGYGRQLGVEKVRNINEIAISGYMPNITVFINMPPKRAFKRMNELKEYDRIEREDISFHQRVYDGFTELSRSEDIMTIDGTGTKFETHEIVKSRLLPILKDAGIV